MILKPLITEANRKKITIFGDDFKETLFSLVDS